jgi:hypothetical protein
VPAPERLIADVNVVQMQGYAVEVVEDGTRYYVVFNDFTLPDCYVPNQTTLMFMADYQYPMSALDMFWTEPHVRLANGALPQNADQFLEFMGRSWQRWSWHHPGWDPAVHSVATHLEVCLDRLAKGC